MKYLPLTCVVLAVTFALLGGPGAHGGEILVFPVDGSHWINMELLIKVLHARGHKVTVVHTSTSVYIKEDSPQYSSITITMPEPMSIEKEDYFVTFLVRRMLEIQKKGASVMALLSFYSEMLTELSKVHEEASQLVVQMFENKNLIQSLRDTKYDMVLLDPAIPVGVLVAHELKLPTVFNVRWITSGEGHFVVAPSPVSYVPTVMVQLLALTYGSGMGLQ
ncbi:UDP-glucuronosyltransferase 1-2-like [Hypomesus transpacificus]|uniref:UDP-glucuronosyltransferase 1-2-like n=1 Tax=Hypomesus transpacificus TaxID=137520 RepID=UPI001F071498|nr:UDP-glucuronosyltransferase 1-2-like [Hypomesus transpacificus]